MVDAKPSLFRRILNVPVEIVVGLYVVANGVASVLFRPVVRALSSLQIVKRLERAIDALPAYVILVLLVVPFGFAELAKVYALVMMGEGHFRSGMTIFIGAYVVSIFVCERTFHAGKNKLMTIGWFKIFYDWVMAIKDHILGWFRETWVWKAAADLRQRMRIAVRRLRTRLRVTFSVKPRGAFERR